MDSATLERELIRYLRQTVCKSLDHLFTTSLTHTHIHVICMWHYRLRNKVKFTNCKINIFVRDNKRVVRFIQLQRIVRRSYALKTTLLYAAEETTNKMYPLFV